MELPPDFPELMTTKEVAEVCRVSDVTVLAWVKSGKIEGIWLSPKVVRFRRTDVETFVARGIAV